MTTEFHEIFVWRVKRHVYLVATMQNYKVIYLDSWSDYYIKERPSMDHIWIWLPSNHLKFLYWCTFIYRVVLNQQCPESSITKIFIYRIVLNQQCPESSITKIFILFTENAHKIHFTSIISGCMYSSRQQYLLAHYKINIGTNKMYFQICKDKVTICPSKSKRKSPQSVTTLHMGHKGKWLLK